MRYLSVCSGIEAATVAWHPLGWRAAAFSEIEDFPSAVLAQHYPDVPNLGDMERHRDWQLSDVDLLVGGTPCQSFSVAGLRKGLDDPRGNLALVYLAIAERLRPTWLVWENVPGVLSSSGGRDFGAFLGGLVELGYGWAYRVLDAQHFGVPQRRRRVFVVGHSGGWQRAAAVLFERESLRRNPAPGREAGEGFAHSLAPSLTGSGRGVDRPGESRGQDPVIAHSLSAEGCDASEDGTGRGTPLIANPLTARMHKGVNTTMDEGVTLVADPLVAREGKTYTHEGGGNFRLRNVIADPPIACFDETQITHPENRSAASAASAALARGARPPSVAFQSSQSGVRTADAHATLDSHNGSRRHAGVVCRSSVRRLTPRECERLQGFPDDYTLIPYRGKPASDTARYRALGNSMAVPVMRWIGERIRKCSCPDTEQR